MRNKKIILMSEQLMCDEVLLSESMMKLMMNEFKTELMIVGRQGDERVQDKVNDGRN